MKIEHAITFLYEGETPQEDKLIPRNWNDQNTKKFIELYEEKPTYPKTVIQEVPVTANITLALCILDEDERWETVAKRLKDENWEGASLSFWQAYAKQRNDIETTTVILPGVRYRDESFIEWVPHVSYHPRVLRKPATKISLKHICSLTQPKVRTLLLCKIEIIKT